MFDAFDAGRCWDGWFEMMHCIASVQVIEVLFTGGKTGGGSGVASLIAALARAVVLGADQGPAGWRIQRGSKAS